MKKFHKNKMPVPYMKKMSSYDNFILHAYLSHFSQLWKEMMKF